MGKVIKRNGTLLNMIVLCTLVLTAVILKPVKAMAETLYETDVTLTHDTVVSGDLTIADKKIKIDLNGHKLTVTGNLLQKNGEMNINKGILTVKGDYRIQNIYESNADGYTWSDGSLVMTYPEDMVVVEGTFATSSDANGSSSLPHNVLTAGTMKVYGDFLQVDHGYNTEAFPAAGTKVVLCGTDQQTISFDNPTKSYFSDLSLVNTNVVVAKHMGGFTMTEDLVFANGLPNGIYGNMNINGHKLTVGGDMVIGDNTASATSASWGTFDVNGGEVIIKGKLRQDASVVKIGGGSITVKGDYRIQRIYESNADGYTWTDGSLVMDDDNDVLRVEGSFYTSSDANGSSTTPHNVFAAGKFYVGGDFCQVNHGYNTAAFPAAGTKVYFNGKNGVKQNIRFDNPYDSYFSDVATINTNIDVLTMMSGWTLSEDVTFNNIPFGTCRNFNMNGYTLTVTGDMVIGDGVKSTSDSKIWGNVTLGYNSVTETDGKLVVKGNLRQDAGVLTVENGTLSVGGDYRIQKVYESNSDGYSWSDGAIVMKKPKGTVIVEGSFYTSSDANGSSSCPDNELTAGSFYVGGDFSQVDHGYNTAAFPAAGTKVYFNGKNGVKQNIRFDNPYDSYFSDVATINTNIDVLTMMGGWTLSEDVAFNNIPYGTCRNFDLNGYSLVVKGDMVMGDSGKGNSNSDIWGNVKLGYNEETETSGKLIVQGNLRQDAGALTVGSGTVRVGGNYRIQKVYESNEDGYTWSDGSLIMDNDAGYVFVGGGFYTSSDANGSADSPNNVLTAGTMEVKGDFIHKYHGYNTEAFPAEGTHKVILSGTGTAKQYITFDKYPDCHLNNVVLTRDSSYYVFSPADCYNNISSTQVEEKYMIIFDANGGIIDDSYVSVVKGNVYGTLPEPTMKWGTFIGWFTDRTEGTEVKATDVPTSDITLYAHWTVSSCAHDNTEIRGKVDATETEDGYTGDTYCLDCGEKLKTGQVIHATGNGSGEDVTPCTHANTEVRGKIDATATTDGYTGDTYCTDCGAKLDTGEVIHATGSGSSTTPSNNDNPSSGSTGGTGTTTTPGTGTTTTPGTGTTTTPGTGTTTTPGTTTSDESDVATTIGDAEDDEDDIVVDQVKNVKLTNKKVKRIYISYKAVSGADGYEIRYATKKSMSGAKKMTAKATKGYFMNKGKKASFKKGKTYYVQVRAFIKDSDGDKVYGAWSAKKKVKIKK